MKPKHLLLLAAGLFLLCKQTPAQSFAINNISLSKEIITSDSSVSFSLTASVDLSDPDIASKVHCKVKGVKTDTSYFNAEFIIPTSEGTFINGVMKDRQMLFINLGTFVLREPVLLETVLIDQNNNRSNTYQTNE